MSKTRSTKAEIIKRREEIQQLIIKGYKNTEIQRNMAEKWNTTERVIADDMRDIAKDWQEKDVDTKHFLRNKYIDRLEFMYNLAMENSKLRDALDIQKEINRVQNVYAEDVKAEEKPKFISLSKKNLKAVGSD